MKQVNIIKGAAIFAVVIMAGAGVLAANAASNGRMMKGGQNFKNLTAEQKTQLEAGRTEAQKAREAKKLAENTALDNNDYKAWLTAVGTDCPMATKINEGNFSKFVEAHKLRQQADVIMKELGVEQFGSEGGKGMMGGRGGQGGCPMHKIN
jgi:hypothetical protein